MQTISGNKRSIASAVALGALALLALVGAASTPAHASTKGRPAPAGKPAHTQTNQVIYGFPLTTTVEDSTQMDIRYRNPDENDLWQRCGGRVSVG